MDKILTEQDKLDILKLVFGRHTEGDILYFYLDLADTKVKEGKAKNFDEAVFQLRKEYLDFQSKKLKEQEKLDILKLVFGRHTEGDILYFYLGKAETKIKENKAKDFSDAVYQLRQEYLDLKKKNPQKRPEDIKKLFNEKDKWDEMNKKIDAIFKEMDDDVKKDTNKNRKPIDITSIKIIQSDNDRK